MKISDLRETLATLEDAERLGAGWSGDAADVRAVLALIDTGRDNLHAARCPACNQVVTNGECGGPGEGICIEAAFAMDLADGRAPVWEGDGEPPTTAELSAILVFWHNAEGTP